MFKEMRSDLSASIIVFFVALPLCLGIALASGAPLFSGIIAGIVGGIVVGIASGSPLGVSGPAAGLAVIVLTAIETLGSWPLFLLAVVLAGIIQLALGFAKAGFIAYFFPSSVINGMLTGIGLLIILKQIPHALGYDKGESDGLSYLQVNGEVTISSIFKAFDVFTPGAVLIAIISISLLIFWDVVLTKKHKLFKLIQGPVVVVAVGILMSYLFQNGFLNFTLDEKHLVELPMINSFPEFINQFTIPDFSGLTNFDVWKIAVVLAIVASIETLLCVEATDKLDPFKRITPTDRELMAQGIGNIAAGMIGGLPITQVIVRSSANISFGGKTKLSAILHGFFLLVSAVTVGPLLNKIPLSSLACILIMVGFKLAKPSLFKKMYQLGGEQFIPFLATIIGILTTDLLKGIFIGLIFSIFYTLRHSYRNAYSLKDEIITEAGKTIHNIVLAEEVSFFNKANIMQALDAIPSNSEVVLNCSNSKSISYDVIEVIKNYKNSAPLKNVSFKTIGLAEGDLN